MNIRMCIHVVLMAICILFLGGCYQNISVKTSPKIEELIAPTGNAELPPAYLKNVRVTKNESDVGVQEFYNTKHIFESKLKQRRLFQDVFSKPFPEPHYELFLNVQQDYDEHKAANIFKGMLIGLTFLLASPVIPVNYDHHVQLVLDTRLPDKTERQYTVNCNASAFGTWTHEQQMKPEAEKQVIDKCFDTLIEKLSSDNSLRLSDEVLSKLNRGQTRPTIAQPVEENVNDEQRIMDDIAREQEYTQKEAMKEQNKTLETFCVAYINNAIANGRPDIIPPNCQPYLPENPQIQTQQSDNLTFEEAKKILGRSFVQQKIRNIMCRGGIDCDGLRGMGTLDRD